VALDSPTGGSDAPWAVVGLQNGQAVDGEILGRDPVFLWVAFLKNYPGVDLETF
jgi:hypothetical protein